MKSLSQLDEPATNPYLKQQAKGMPPKSIATFVYPQTEKSKYMEPRLNIINLKRVISSNKICVQTRLTKAKQRLNTVRALMALNKHDLRSSRVARNLRYHMPSPNGWSKYVTVSLLRSKNDLVPLPPSTHMAYLACICPTCTLLHAHVDIHNNLPCLGTLYSRWRELTKV
jgi:hypothetical protein